MSVAPLPVAGPLHPATLPAPVERTLDNGLRVIAFAQHALPLIAAQLVVRAGGASEHEDEAGLAAFVAALLTQGTRTRDAIELAAQSDGLGARLDAGSGYDASVVNVSATTPVFPAAFELLRDVVVEPAFLGVEVDRVRTKSIGDLALTYANPSAVARLTAQRVAYGGAPYGHPLAGTAATLASLTRDRVVAFHEQLYRPDDAVLVIGGDITPDDAFALAERVLGGWRAPATALPPRPSGTPPAPRARTIIIDKPDAGRTALVAGRLGITRSSPDYATGVVTMAVLSGYSGRMNQEIRVKRGLSYGAGAGIAARRLAGLFTAATLVDHAKALEALDVTAATIRSLVDAPVTDDDLVTRKATVTGGFYRGIETIDGIAATIGEHVLYDVPLAQMASWVPDVEAVDAAMVRSFAQRTLVDDNFAVLVGDASKYADALRARGGEVTTIAGDALDLGSPALEVTPPV